jgi:hypothetical protein
MMGETLGALAGSEGLELFGTVPLTLGERSPLRVETYESDICRRKNKEGVEKKGRESKAKKITFEWSSLTGGRKEGNDEGRWLCLSLPFLVNRGFGNKTSNWGRLA